MGGGTEHVGSGDLGADSGVSRDQLSWDTGGRQEWCLEGGDLTSETAETMDACPPASAPHPRAPSPPGHTPAPLCPSELPAMGTSLCLEAPQAKGRPPLYTRGIKAWKISLLTLRKQEKGKRFVFECKVSLPLGPSLGLGSGEPHLVGPICRPGHGEPGRVSPPSHAGLVSVPAHPLH